VRHYIRNHVLIQVLLPLYDNEGELLSHELFQAVAGELAQAFGGLTAYTRAPAQGLWMVAGEQPSRDEIIIYEVMAEQLDRAWWKNYRRGLESRYRQQEIIIRVQEIELL
jgi:hypothetical protein